MAILAKLHHVTRYLYDRPVTLGPQVIRLRPAPHSRTAVPSYSLKVVPEQHFVNWQQDPHGNWLARFVFPEKTTEFSVTVDLVADMAVVNPFDFFIEAYAETFPFTYAPNLAEELAPYLVTEPTEEHFERYLAAIPREPMQTVNFLVALNQRLQEEIRYVIRMEPGVQTPDETLERASGSCRDSAWLLVQLARRLGLAARFVSGYLIQLKPDLQALDGPPAPTRTSPTSTPGRRSMCRAPAGSGSTRPRACSAARDTSRSPQRRITARPRRSPVRWTRPR